jgi:catechol 2,3-dioxygenase-like lactoylglutathione lyase family enzyme
MNKLDHIGVYVRSIESASKIYARFGVTVERVVDLPTPNGRTVRIAFLPLSGGVDLELIEAPGALDNGVEPLNHICFEVPDIEAELASLKADGIPLESDRPRVGAAARLVAFLDKVAADGVRIEIAEK